MQRKKKDAGAPKRPMSAYMMWLNASRERIKSENPGISITEISKKAGEMWRQLGKDDKEVSGGGDGGGGGGDKRLRRFSEGVVLELGMQSSIINNYEGPM